MNRLKAFLKRSDPQANVQRLRRRKSIISAIHRRLSIIRLTLLAIGYLWLIILPIPQLSNRTYIDENALQPAQVMTHWNWPDVHRADSLLGQLESLRDNNATSGQRAEFFRREFSKIGLVASTQNFTFRGSKIAQGTNAYAILSSPRASGAEAMVISASWMSRIGEGNGALNLRGVAMVLSLAAFLKGYSLWAKDIIFIISDGYLEGMHAWLSAYHGNIPSNLDTEELHHSSGVIWTALNIDYPGHSFSHLGVFSEGLNGRLPNQDLLNSLVRISQNTGGVRVTLYDHLDPSDYPGRAEELLHIPPWIPQFVRGGTEFQKYIYRAGNVARHMRYQASGQASGVHGLLHRFRIDAITIFAIPASGPHGFHAMGRIVESTLRTMNNLLERLHASFFFYILTGPDSFVKIGGFLPGPILISVSMMLTGLEEWVNAGWTRTTENNVDGRKDSEFHRSAETWTPKRRPVLSVIALMASTHIVGVILFFIITSSSLSTNGMALPMLFGLLYTLPLIISSSLPLNWLSNFASISSLLKAMNLCLTATLISTISVLNFSLAAALAVMMGLPLILTSSLPSTLRLAKYTFYSVSAMGWMLFPSEAARVIWNWEILGVWLAPLICIIYAPLMMQASLVSLQKS